MKIKKIQAMHPSASMLAKNQKTSSSAASKISSVIDDLFLPMLQSTQIRSYTDFTPLHVNDVSMIEYISLQNPGLVESKSIFLQHFGDLYDEWKFTG